MELIENKLFGMEGAPTSVYFPNEFKFLIWKLVVVMMNIKSLCTQSRDEKRGRTENVNITKRRD